MIAQQARFDMAYTEGEKVIMSLLCTILHSFSYGFFIILSRPVTTGAQVYGFLVRLFSFLFYTHCDLGLAPFAAAAGLKLPRCGVYLRLVGFLVMIPGCRVPCFVS